MRLSRPLIVISVFSILIDFVQCDRKAPKQIFRTQNATFVLDTITTELRVPNAMDFLSNELAIVTDRLNADTGIFILDLSSGKLTPICNVPHTYQKGGGGIMDVLVPAEFDREGWIYYSYSVSNADSASTLVVARSKLRDNCFYETQQLFEALPFYKSDGGHFGNRLQIKDGYLYITMGDRYYARDSAQSLSNHLGKVLRIYTDGRIPDDNPFTKVEGAKKEIWSYGHRNPQGLAFNPLNGELWLHEHGPKGGDEINIIKPGLNYGWPVVCYGIDYDGKPIGAGLTKKEGMTDPLYYYVPSIAPSGMTFYTGRKFPEWKNNIFIGALALRHMNRLVLFDNKIVKEERLFEDQHWRIRFVAESPDGLIYFGVDRGMILRMRPK